MKIELSKPRANRLNQILMSRKPGYHSDPKHKSRAQTKADLRKELRS